MRITNIKTIGFRKFEKEFETPLYDITTIIGGNTKGKSNILYAIIWAFLGTNLSGDDKVWIGNKNSENCYIELTFIDNLNKEHTLIRYKNKYDNKKNFVMLDNKKAEPENLQSYYLDKKLFLSILNPNYFITKKPAEQKELLDKYLPQIDISKIYEKLDNEEKQYLEEEPTNILEYIKDLNSNKKMYEDKIKNIKGKIEYAENIVNNPIGSLKTFEKSEELSLANQELSFLSSKTSSPNIEEVNKIITELSNQIKQTDTIITDLDNKIQNDKNTYWSVKNDNIENCCQLCGQVLKKEESKLITLENLKLSIENDYIKKAKYETDLRNLRSKLIVQKSLLYALESPSKKEKENQINNIKLQISNLEREKSEIDTYNNSILIQENNKTKAQNDILLFKKQIEELNNLIENIRKAKDIAQKLYVNCIEEKMQYANQYLKDVKIKYYSVLKDTGELKTDFIITYKDNELKDLSRSEVIATSLELCNMLNKISNINLPIFIDDSESCADYNFIEQYANNTQILIARVEKGQELTITENHLTEIPYLQVA